MSTNDFKQRYGPVALVTGASSGIGRSFAELLASKGFDLVVAARRVDRLNDLAQQLKTQHGVRVQVLQIDLSGAKAAEQIQTATSSLDIGLLISNAGYGYKGPYEDCDPVEMSQILMVNCHTPMLLAHSFIPRLRARGKGGIIFTSSIEGLMGMPYSTVYASTKAFVNGLGQGLWGELTPEGIDVLALCPGATDTEALARAGMDARTFPNLMSPSDVARLALENIQNGPIYIPSDYYRVLIERMASMPRREALTSAANSMKQERAS